MIDGFIKWNKFTWKSVLFLVCIVGLCMFLQKRNEKQLFDKKLLEVANEINKHTPVLVDSTTRLDDAIALTGNKFQYNYTLLTVDKESTDTLSLKHRLEEKMIASIKTNLKKGLLINNKTTLLYNYRDKNGSYLFNFAISSDNYEN